MASFDAHIQQANNNLIFLVEINSTNSVNWDWQITVSFYSALHLINAHLAVKGNQHHRTHEDVKAAINPHATLAIGKLPNHVYLAYVKLEGLSRRARYLCSDDNKDKSTDAFFTYDKHFAKAVRHLDTILDFFKKEYLITYPSISLSCIQFSGSESFQIIKVDRLRVPVGPIAK